MSIHSEGSVSFWLRHEHNDWSSNGNGYNFGSMSAEGLTLIAVKHPDKAIEIILSGPFGQTHQFKRPIPSCDERGLFVAITWKRPYVILYLNGKEAEKRQLIHEAANR